MTAAQEERAVAMLRKVPLDRLLLETDAPDGLPRLPLERMVLLHQVPITPGDAEHDVPSCTDLNSPANIEHVAHFVASLLNMPVAELAAVAFHNSMRLFFPAHTKE